MISLHFLLSFIYIIVLLLSSGEDIPYQRILGCLLRKAKAYFSYPDNLIKSSQLSADKFIGSASFISINC